MGKVSKKRKSNNTNPIQKLSDIVSELADFDKVKKQVSFSLLLTKARSTARYSKEKKLSKDTKSKIKSLFSAEHLLAVTYMRDFLLGLPDLSRDERNYWHKKLTEFYDKTKNLLFESLDNNVSNLHKFNELVREELNINQGLAFDADSYRGCGTIDKKTRVVKFPKPAKTRQEIEQQEKDGQSKTNIPDYKALNLAKVPISKLIQQSESHTLEFKETLEYDVKQNRHNHNLNKDCLKTIAAFLNTDGGTLLIGVKDNGEITGIERDLQYVQRKNLDGFQLKLRNLIRNRFAPAPLGKVKIKFEKLAKGIVCKIDVNQVNRNQIIHLDNEVYIRDGNMTIKLYGRDLTGWIQQRGQAANIGNGS